MSLPETLFYLLHLPALTGWALMLIAPRSTLTTRWVHSGFLLLVLCGCYAALLFCVVGLGMAAPDAGMASLPAVAALFSHPVGQLTGWAHFLAFDLFVGAWIMRDARGLGYSHASTLPALLLTLVFGPLGLLLHLLRRGLSGRGWAL